jgi:hypothetical protein
VAGLTITDYSGLLHDVNSAYPVNFERARDFEHAWAGALDDLRAAEQKVKKQTINPALQWPWSADSPNDSDYGHLFDLHDEIAASLLVPEEALSGEYERWPDLRQGIVQTIQAIGAMREQVDYSSLSASVQDTIDSGASYEDAVGEVGQAAGKVADQVGDALTVGGIGLVGALVIVGGIYVLLAARVLR